MGSPEGRIGERNELAKRDIIDRIDDALSPEAHERLDKIAKIADVTKKIVVGALALYGGFSATADAADYMNKRDSELREEKYLSSPEHKEAQAQDLADKRKKEDRLKKSLSVWAELMSEMAAGSLGEATPEEKADLIFTAQTRKYLDRTFENLQRPPYHEFEKWKNEVKKALDEELQHDETRTLELIKARKAGKNKK